MGTLRIQRFKATDAPELMAQAWRLRHRVFLERLGWAVQSVDLLEIDPLDRLAVHLAVLVDERVTAYLRMLQASGPTLLHQHFAGLVPESIPRSPRVWEASRFVVEPNHPKRAAAARRLVQEGMRLGHDLGASQLVAVTEPHFETFLKRCGVPIARVADPMRVGHSTAGPVYALVVATDINAASLASAGVQLQARAA